MVKPACKGKVALMRYADDAVICCQYESDAQRIRAALPKRLTKFKLALNEEKTKLVPFDKRQVGKGVKQGTFDFLGFTFYWGKSRAGLVVPKLKTRSKTKKAKLNKVTAWIKELKGRISLNGIWKTFRAKLNGHIQYYGVSYNAKEVHSFLQGATKIMFKWLNRRSQRKSYSWEQFLKYIERHPLPRVKVVHPMFQLSGGR
jgi:hypothetical protein